MRSPACIIDKITSGLWLTMLLTIAVVSADGQKIAVLLPDRTPQAIAYSARLSSLLEDRFKIFDAEMADAAFRSVTIDAPYNLSIDTSKNIGSVVGCDYFILLRSATLRRSSLDKPDYFEAFAAAFVISARTGRLIIWRLRKAEAETPDKAGEQLLASADILAREISNELPGIARAESPEIPPLEEVPAANTPAAREFRAPVPYRRIAPEYTQLAYLYGVTATVEIRVDLDAEGKILRTEIVRWAGYGLDEAVDAAVRKMNWRPAERGGKTLPIRFLLRYNFKKIEKEQ